VPEIHEVVVVGAGMFGSAAAKYLSRAGADVLIIGPSEPRDLASASLPEFGAHFDQARITRRVGWDPVWGTIDARSLERFRDIEAESGIGLFQECGSLVLMAACISHRTDAMLRRCESEGIIVERLPEQALRQEFPALGIPPLRGGVEALLERKQAGHLNPRQLVRAQLRLAEVAGGRLLRAVVTSVWRDGPGGRWLVRAVAGERAIEVGADQLVIATGAMANLSGALPPGLELDLHVFAEPNLLFEIGEEQLERLRGLPSVVTVDPEDSGNNNMSVYLLPPVRYPDEKWYMRIGPGMQPIVQELRTVGDMSAWHTRQRISSAQGRYLDAMMRMMVPGLESASVREACCAIDKTASRNPYIGHPGEEESLIVIAGGNGHGARGSDEIGRLAAAAVLGQPWDFPVPLKVFTPLTAVGRRDEADGGSPGYLKPPFGLC
jgi:sarcosine oxidase